MDYSKEQESLISAMCYGTTGSKVRDDVMQWLREHDARLLRELAGQLLLGGKFSSQIGLLIEKWAGEIESGKETGTIFEIAEGK